MSPTPTGPNRSRRWVRLFSFSALGLSCALSNARAQLSLPTSIPDGGLSLDAVIPIAVTETLVTAVGITQDHRAYQPATSLGTSLGLDIGIAATLSSIPPTFATSLAAASGTLSSLSALSALPVLPAAKLMLHKGISDRLEVGGSLLYFPGYVTNFAGEGKFVVYNPDEEGPTWAVRCSYSYMDLMSYIRVTTLSPQIIVSKKMKYVDPYLGLGYQLVRGRLYYSIPFPAPIAQTIELSSSLASSSSWNAFIGVGVIFGPTGFKLTFEGSYHSLGYHTLGTKIGFSF